MAPRKHPDLQRGVQCNMGGIINDRILVLLNAKCWLECLMVDHGAAKWLVVSGRAGLWDCCGSRDRFRSWFQHHTTSSVKHLSTLLRGLLQTKTHLIVSPCDAFKLPLLLLRVSCVNLQPETAGGGMDSRRLAGFYEQNCYSRGGDYLRKYRYSPHFL